MSKAYDDATEEPAAHVSTALTQQMLHLTNRFEEERLKLEERTFWTYDEGGEPGEG